MPLLFLRYCWVYVLLVFQCDNSVSNISHVLYISVYILEAANC